MTGEGLRLGTRGSALALWQAGHVKAEIERETGLPVEIVRIRTTGDKVLDVPLARVGGKGLFVKEIEEALLSGAIDLAVHSMKDVPTELPAGLSIVCVTKREDPRDAFLSAGYARFGDLPRGARVGTSSLRRRTQLLGARPDLDVRELRGNLDTRIRKMEEGAFDAIVLAAAGLRRLGWEGKIREYLPVELSLPAIGQGALGIEAREGDARVAGAVAFLADRDATACVRAERGFLDRLGGGCQVPVAAHAVTEGDGIALSGLIGRPDGAVILRAARKGPASAPEALGAARADERRAAGGRRILEAGYRQAAG
jgi:hydroxymethylbilane synthase